MTIRPATMARVFEAYHCRHAMQLDMNALEHTYLALYVQRSEARLIEHLVQGIGKLDRSSPRGLVPRFLGGDWRTCSRVCLSTEEILCRIGVP